MGWTFYHVPKGTRTREAMRREFSDVVVLDDATVGSTYFAAVKLKDSDLVIAAVVLTQRNNRDYHNFGYKDLTEFDGPYDYRCPKRILNLLSPLDDESDPSGWARRWRHNVLEHHKHANKKNDLEDGTLIRLDKPINLTNGQTVEYFKVSFTKDWGKTRRSRKFLISDEFGRVSTYAPTRVRMNINNYKYEIVEPKEFTKDDLPEWMVS